MQLVVWRSHRVSWLFAIHINIYRKQYTKMGIYACYFIFQNVKFTKSIIDIIGLLLLYSHWTVSATDITNKHENLFHQFLYAQGTCIIIYTPKEILISCLLQQFYTISPFPTNLLPLIFQYDVLTEILLLLMVFFISYSMFVKMQNSLSSRGLHAEAQHSERSFALKW